MPAPVFHRRGFDTATGSPEVDAAITLCQTPHEWFFKAGAQVSDPVYAVGDIHGQLEFLEQALSWIESDGGPDAEIVFLGDLVDRGPASCAVIDRLLQGQNSGRKWRVLKGNHDRLFTRFLDSGTVDDVQIKSGVTWMHPRIGGVATLASYGISSDAGQPFEQVLNEARQAVPDEHRDFLANLPTSFERGELLFVHAGIAPGVRLADQDEDDLIWIRDIFLNDPRSHPWLVVHGHTAIDMPFNYGNRVNLDGGGGYGRTIFPAVFEGRKCWLLDENGRLPLVP